LVGAAEDVVTEGEADVGVGVEEAPEKVNVPDTLPVYVWGVVDGVTAMDSEEMSAESAERRDGAAVVSNERVLNGRPLVAGSPLGWSTGDAETCATNRAVSVATVASFMGTRGGQLGREWLYTCA
jgi:hypothetical protein